MKRPAASHPAMRVMASIMLLLGALLVLGSIFADRLGGEAGLGWWQLTGVIIGLVLALLGGAWLIQPPTSRGIDRSLE